MSVYGIQVRNDRSKIIIDSNHINHCLTQSGSASITTYNAISIDTQLTPPIIAIQPPTNCYASPWSIVKNSAGRWVSFCLSCSPGYSATVPWRNYNDSGKISQESYGIRLFDRRGRPSFDSGNTPLLIEEVHSVTAGVEWLYDEVLTLSHPNVSNPYYIFSPIGSGVYCTWEGYYSNGNPVTYVYWLKVGAKKISATQVNFAWFTVSAGWVYGAYTVSNAWWMPMDVVLVL